MTRVMMAVAVLATSAALAGAPAGRLAIKTVEGVRIQVDGKPATASRALAVEAGSHVVRIYDGEDVVAEHQVEVGADETVWVELRVVRKKAPGQTVAPQPEEVPSGVANVEVRSHNVVGDVAVDGVVIGWAPLRVHNLPAGKHTVQVLVDGVPRRTKQVVVKPGTQRIDIL